MVAIPYSSLPPFLLYSTCICTDLGIQIWCPNKNYAYMLARGPVAASGWWAAPKPSGPVGRCPLGGRGGEARKLKFSWIMRF